MPPPEQQIAHRCVPSGGGAGRDRGTGTFGLRRPRGVHALLTPNDGRGMAAVPAHRAPGAAPAAIGACSPARMRSPAGSRAGPATAPPGPLPRRLAVVAVGLVGLGVLHDPGHVVEERLVV